MIADFFIFLKNSKFLFRFFEELSQERVEIEDLEVFDTYAEYSEHLEILKTLLKNYENLLDKKGLYDRITLPKIYRLNEDFIKSSNGFLLHLEGLLSRFEYELLQKTAKLCELKVELEINPYNKKLIDIFGEFDLEIGYKYLLNLSKKECEIKKKLVIKR